VKTSDKLSNVGKNIQVTKGQEKKIIYFPLVSSSSSPPPPPPPSSSPPSSYFLMINVPLGREGTQESADSVGMPPVFKGELLH